MNTEATMPDAIPPGLLAKDDLIADDVVVDPIVERSTKRQRACHDADTENRAREGVVDVVGNKYDDVNNESQFKMLPFYGEHKRAVSSLAFAPTSSSSSLTHGAGAMSYNSNAIQVPILCASASADGCAKVWDLTQSMNSSLSSSSSSSSSSSEIISGTVPNTASTKLDPKISLIGHGRGINGEI